MTQLLTSAMYRGLVSKYVLTFYFLSSCFKGYLHTFMPNNEFHETIHHKAWLIAALLLMLATATVSHAQTASQSMATRTAVPAGEWQAIKMRGLPGGASLEVQLETDGQLKVFIVDEAQFRRLAGGGEALFASQFSDGLQFRLRIPASADYFLVLDNRQGETSRQVSVGITGAR